MNLVAAATNAVERMPLPDSVTRTGIALLVERTSRKLRRVDPTLGRKFAAGMTNFPIALHTDDAGVLQFYPRPPPKVFVLPV
jgi:cyclopropane-fatty-acyl-phospholipid synthase